MTDQPQVDGAGTLSEGFARLLADYERHLVAERDLTAHSVRAYLGEDVDEAVEV